jgi:hypothetical protein
MQLPGANHALSRCTGKHAHAAMVSEGSHGRRERPLLTLPWPHSLEALMWGLQRCA